LGAFYNYNFEIGKRKGDKRKAKDEGRKENGERQTANYRRFKVQGVG
jgi:hypothetical protein